MSLGSVATDAATRAEGVHRERRDQRLRRAMVVQTASGSVYRLGEADEKGRRVLVKDGANDEMHGALVILRMGDLMVFCREDGARLVTSTVTGIDPSPDE
ncbi:hypothetical protein HY478_01780 [Candidatus Uhrbacteria bacterium]|nr:hypothetical protein [Candidatus Uhrbacteria bacterium]